MWSSVAATYGYTFFDYYGTSLSAGIDCPANCTCGITSSPLVVKVGGKMTAQLCGSTNSADKTFPCTDPAPSWCPTTTFNMTVGKEYAFRSVSPRYDTAKPIADMADRSYP